MEKKTKINKKCTSIGRSRRTKFKNKHQKRMKKKYNGQGK